MLRSETSYYCGETSSVLTGAAGGPVADPHGVDVAVSLHVRHVVGRELLCAGERGRQVAPLCKM